MARGETESQEGQLPRDTLLGVGTLLANPRSGQDLLYWVSQCCRAATTTTSLLSCLTWPFQKPKMNGSTLCLENFAALLTRAGCKTRLRDPLRQCDAVGDNSGIIGCHVPRLCVSYSTFDCGSGPAWCWAFWVLSSNHCHPCLFFLCLVSCGHFHPYFLDKEVGSTENFSKSPTAAQYGDSEFPAGSPASHHW